MCPQNGFQKVVEQNCYAQTLDKVLMRLRFSYSYMRPILEKG